MLKKVLFTAIVLAGLVGAPRPALAVTCNRSLLDCYAHASKQDSFWYRWADGLDCELTYTGCVRRALIG